MNSPYEASIRIIKENQDLDGAFIASPAFSQYKYCWFRDSAFIAYSMDLMGEHHSSQLFHNWAIRTIKKYKGKIRKNIKLVVKGDIPEDIDCFHSRFTLDGSEVADDWGHHQLDGLGTWLWSLMEHIKITKQNRIPSDYKEAVYLISDYLKSFWKYPCFDCWEENPTQIHTYTLASIYGGLKSLSQIDGIDRSSLIDEIKAFILQNAVYKGHFIKNIGSHVVDANLIGLSIPNLVVQPNDPIIKETITQIKNNLVRGGGVHRNSTDTYYGGGQWLLLTAWLGWYSAAISDINGARVALTWVEAQMDEKGNLPEQTSEHMIHPTWFQHWVNKWGQIASPLLWSHAMYLILKYKIDNEMNIKTDSLI
jgi:GH15 family glucan-1,4-alpha-glucosidase